MNQTGLPFTLGRIDPAADVHDPRGTIGMEQPSRDHLKTFIDRKRAEMRGGGLPPAGGGSKDR